MQYNDSTNNPYEKKFEYMDALAGAGKTYAIVRDAWTQASKYNKKVLIVQPTKTLIDNTIEEELSQLRPVKHRCIHGDNTDDVVSKIVEHLNKAKQGEGEILFITHAAFFKLPFFNRRGDWTVFFDEVFQVEGFTDWNIPDSQELIVPYLDWSPHNCGYGRLFPRGKEGRTHLQKMASNANRDDIWQLFQEFAAKLLSEHWDTYMIDNQYVALLDGLDYNKRLTAFHILRPSVFTGFDMVIFASACFTDSLLFKLWSYEGVKFSPRPAKSLRYATHDNGHLLDIFYLTEEIWSKSLRDRQIKGQPILEVYIDRIKAEIGSERAIWLGNKDIDDGIFDVETFERLPNTPHGINTYQSFHNVVILSALNPPPAHLTFLESQGISKAEVQTAIYRAAVYQAAMRSSLRNPSDPNRKRIIVADRETADWVAGLFAGSRVAPLGGRAIGSVKGAPGRIRKYDTGADRMRACRMKQEVEQLVQQAIITGDEIGEYPYELLKRVAENMTEIGDLFAETQANKGKNENTKSCDENTLLDGVFVTTFHEKLSRVREATPLKNIFENIYDKHGAGYEDTSNHEVFIAHLKELHKDVVTRKEDAVLISAAEFETDAAEQKGRVMENVRLIRGLWFDNDGGDLSPEEFASYFPTLRVVIWNTYRSKPENRRWRAFIPTTCAMSIRVYTSMLDQVFKKLANNGYYFEHEIRNDPKLKNKKCHGFDISKKTATSMFYLPAQAENPEDSFFQDYNDKRRAPLNPLVWIRKTILPPLPEPIPEPVVTPACAMQLPEGGSEALKHMRQMIVNGPESVARRERMVTTATERFATVPEGQGNKALFNYAIELARANLSEAEIIQIISQNIHLAKSPQDRKRDIKRTVKNAFKKQIA